MSLLTLFLIASLVSPTPKDDDAFGKLYGRVLDKTTKEPLIGANVIILESTKGAATDLDGHFTIENVPVGIVAVKVSMLGYLSQVKAEISVNPRFPTQLVIELENSAVELGEEILVESSYFYKPTETPTSLQAFSYEEIRRAPGAASDISRMIQTMPGVVQTTDQRNDLIVRGGSPAENLNLIDGFEIPNINHFGSQGTTGGPIGMVQTEFISEATFLTGGFPAIYGDRLSSVLDIKLREGNPDRFSGIFDLSMAGSGAILEGPLNDNTTYLVNVRRSYLDLLNESIGLTAVPKYTNLNAKVSSQLNAENKINVIALAGWDDIHFEDDASETDLSKRLSEDVKSGGNQYLVGLNWQQLYGKNGFGDLYVWQTSNTYDVEVTDLIKDPNELSFKNESSENQTGLKYQVSNYLNDNIEITNGVVAKYVDFNYNIFAAGGDTSQYGNVETGINNNFNKSTYKGHLYSQLVLKPTERLKVTAGVRMNYYELLKDEYSVDPRIGLSYSVNPMLTLNASAGLFHQSPELIWMYGTDTPNIDLTYMSASHYVLGMDYYFAPDIKLTVEGYLKDYSGYAVSTAVPSLSLANSGDDYGPNGIGSLVSKGDGQSYGIDLFLQKKMKSGLYGLISYSYSQTEHKALDGIDRPGAFDIPHVFTISGGYQLTESIEISSKVRYVSGRPYTPINEVESAASNRQVLDMSNINSKRYPDYFRLDFRFDHRSNFDNFSIVSYFEIQNLTARENVYAYFWNQRSKEIDTVYQWGFFPIGGVKIEF